MNGDDRADIVILGGLGESQCGDIFAAVKALGLNPYSPPGNDQYNFQLASYILNGPSRLIALIGHSLACDTVINASRELLKNYRIEVAYVCIIEPVWAKKQNPMAAQADWFRADFLIDFPQAEVEGMTPITVKGTGHNSICHDPTTISRIVERVRGLVQSSQAASVSPPLYAPATVATDGTVAALGGA